MEKYSFNLPVSPKKIAFLLFGFVLFLTCASLIGQYYKEFFVDNELLIKVINKFDLDLEKNNVPTWYQSSTLLLSSFLLLIIALAKNAAKDSDYRFWGLLSAIFLYLSLDEAVSLHEQLTMPLRTTFDLGGIFYLSWVIPAVVFLAIFFLVFFRFLLRLPPQTRLLMVTAGIIYVLGAVGVEMLGSNYLYVTNDLPTRITDFRYVLLTTFEEFLEMSGIVIFIYSLLSHLFPQESKETVTEMVEAVKSSKKKIALNLINNRSNKNERKVILTNNYAD